MSQEKVLVDYYVDPEELKTAVQVVDPVRVKFVNVQSARVRNLLGNTGRKLAQHGCAFIFDRGLALCLLEEGLIKIVQ